MQTNVPPRPLNSSAREAATIPTLRYRKCGYLYTRISFFPPGFSVRIGTTAPPPVQSYRSTRSFLNLRPRWLALRTAVLALLVPTVTPLGPYSSMLAVVRVEQFGCRSCKSDKF